MRISKKDISTVIIVGATESEAKSLRIKTKHINRFKHYTLGTALTLLILTGLIIFLSFSINRTNNEKEGYLTEIALLKSQVPKAADTIKAKNHIRNIENKLDQINQFLIKRGIEGFAVENTGGNDDIYEQTLGPTEIYNLYDDRLNDILSGVAFTPIGYPSNAQITSTFGYRRNPFGGGRIELHSGIDFKGRTGDPVKSTANGTVTYAGWLQGYGNCIKIEHKNNLETIYGHLSKINVKKGQLVNTGDIIGKVGSTGHSTGPHLHYEVRKQGKPINPIQFLTLK